MRQQGRNLGRASTAVGLLPLVLLAAWALLVPCATFCATTETLNTAPGPDTTETRIGSRQQSGEETESLAPGLLASPQLGDEEETHPTARASTRQTSGSRFQLGRDRIADARLTSGTLSAFAPKRLYKAKRTAGNTLIRTATPYLPGADLRVDAILHYGADDSLTTRIDQWKRRGYAAHAIAGAAYGPYADFLNGDFDGQPHTSEGQTDSSGTMLLHHDSAPFIVPTAAFSAYLISLAETAITAGAKSFFLAQPEFSARAGYSSAFRRMWKDEFGDEWEPPSLSPDAWWRAAKLKYLVYKRTIDQVFRGVKELPAASQRKTKCYISTYSLLNCALRAMVSPLAGLADLDDFSGYVAQVDAGTAGMPILYNGAMKDRVFETAFLEFSSIYGMAAPIGRSLWFSPSPLADDATTFTWDQQQRAWERIVVASLLFPEVSQFEVMRWPERLAGVPAPVSAVAGKTILTTASAPLSREAGISPEDESGIDLPPANEHDGRDAHSTSGTRASRGQDAHTTRTQDTHTSGPEKRAAAAIPPSFVSEIATVANALCDMQQRSSRWECGARGIAVLASDTMLFQRGNPWSDDPHFSGLMGLAMPLVKHGIPVRMVYLEQLLQQGTLDGVDALLVSYDFMKPLRPEYHEILMHWVEAGGTLVYFGDDSDPFLKIHEWWNTGDLTYASPREDLFARLKLPRGTAPGIYKVGEGWLAFSRQRPDKLATVPYGGSAIIEQLEKVFDKASRRLITTDYLVLHRGQYTAGGVLEDSLSSEPLRINGTFADLMTTGLEIRQNPVFAPGSVFLLRRLDARDRPTTLPIVIGGNARVEAVDQVSTDTVRLTVYGPASAPQGVMRIQLPRRPIAVISTQGLEEAQSEWSRETRSVLVRFRNRPTGTELLLKY